MEIIALLTFLSFLVIDYFVFNVRVSLRYKYWYRPWLLFIIILGGFYFGSDVNTIITTVFPGRISLFYDFSFVIILAVFWIILKIFLKYLLFDDLLIRLLRKMNSVTQEEKSQGASNYLIWPYYLLPPDRIFLKAGTGFFKILFLVMAAILFLLYLFLVVLNARLPVSVPTGMALIASLVFVEWAIYLTSDKEIGVEEEEPPVTHSENKVDYQKLWQRYLDTFPTGFSGAFVGNNDDKYDAQKQINERIIRDLLGKFTTSGCDIIASELNLVSSFHKFSRILFESLNQGGNILILAEIPQHFKISTGSLGIPSGGNDTRKDITELFSEYLSEMIQKQVPSSSGILKIHYYNAEQVPDADQRRILLTSVNNILNENLLRSSWLKKLELLIVINFHDSCLSTISEDRQFTILLDSIQSRYKTLIFSPFRKEIHAGLEYTWMLDKIEERKFEKEIQAVKSYYIGFNFEKWRENWNNIASPFNNDPLVSGIELTSLALDEKINHIHLFECAYSEFSEGKEDLGVLLHKIGPEIQNMSQDKIQQGIFINHLPIPVTSFGGCSPFAPQHFSIVLDAENNAPKIYNKYAFLGASENFIITLTKPHLYRDYFTSNFSYLLNSPVEAIQPQLSKSKINLSLQLLTLLANNAVEKNTIIRLFTQFGMNVGTSLHEEISRLFLKYFNYNIRDNFVLRYRSNYVFEDGEYRLMETYALSDKFIDDGNGFPFLRNVIIVDSNDNKLFAISANLLFQNYLPGQIIALNGRPYLFENFNPGGYTLQVRKTETRNVLFYKPVLQVRLTGESEEADLPFIETFHRTGIEITLSRAISEINAVVETFNYFEFISAYHSPLATEKQPILHNLSEREQMMVRRSYARGRFLKISWESLPDFKGYLGEITTMLHILLYESVRIFYPYHYQYLIFCSDNSLKGDTREKLPWIFPKFNIENSGLKVQNQKASCEIYILEDSFADLGILKSLQRNFTYMMNHIFDLLLWYGEDPKSVIPGSDQCRLNIKDKKAFLKYGFSDLCLIDVDLMVRFIENHLPVEKDTLYETCRKRQGPIMGLNVICDFCGGSFIAGQGITMEDGLQRCHQCSEGAIDTFESAKSVLEESKRLYKEFLGIDFNLYQFDFVPLSAKELHSKSGREFDTTSMFDTRKVVGLAADQDQDKVYVERGYKRSQTLSTINHELCHIWEFNELDCMRINSDPKTQVIIEGLAVWTDLFLLRKAGLNVLADQIEFHWLNDTTEYGNGLRYINEHFPENPHQQLKSVYLKAT